MNSANDRPRTSVRDCVRTASVQTHARSKRGNVPKGSLGTSPPAIMTSANGPFRRT